MVRRRRHRCVTVRTYIYVEDWCSSSSISATTPASSRALPSRSYVYMRPECVMETVAISSVDTSMNVIYPHRGRLNPQSG
jgi:hypothetical protein